MSKNNERSGVYEIRNTISGKGYVGSSTNISRRWYQHRRRLGNNSHKNPYLQNAWNKYGGDVFDFRVLVYAETAEYIRIENLLLATNNYEYNIAKDATKSQLGRPRSVKTKQKLSRINSGKNHPQYGTLHSEETRNKLSIANTGNRHTEETKRKISKATAGKNNPMYGTHHNQNQKKSNKAKRIDLPTEELMSLRDRGYFYREIAEMFGVGKETVRKRCLEMKHLGQG